MSAETSFPTSTAPTDEQPLGGGNMGGAVRVGATVRKRAQPQTATIQRLVRTFPERG